MTKQEFIEIIKSNQRNLEQCKESLENIKNLIIEHIIDCEDIFEVKAYLEITVKEIDEESNKAYEEQWKDKDLCKN